MNEIKKTPLMQQYFVIKEQYPDALLFFQVGDFYELFFEDARQAASFLAIALTTRGKNNGEDIPLCGVPVHALNHYLTKLVRGGFKVTICDQVGEVKPGTVVKREVSRVLTPGTLTDPAMLDEHSPSYFLIFSSVGGFKGLLFVELLTAQAYATVVPSDDVRALDAELARFMPDEMVIPNEKHYEQHVTAFKKKGYAVSRVMQVHDEEHDSWVKQQLSSLLPAQQAYESITKSASLLYAYLRKHQERALSQFKALQWYEPEDYVLLDMATQRNLELVVNMRDGGRVHTLLWVLDQARTAMGSRMIKKWLMRPLVDRRAIEQRHHVVQLLLDQVIVLQRLEEQLVQLADLERIIGRIALNRAHHHDYLALKDSLMVIPQIKNILVDHLTIDLIRLLVGKFSDFSPLRELLQVSLHDEPGGTNLIKKGFDHHLDHLRDLLDNGEQALIHLQNKEIERTGIASLKIGYNQVSGYYFEVTTPNLDKVPSDYVPYQRMSNRSRFVTPQLKELERDLYKARTQLEAIEKEVYERVKLEIMGYISLLRAQVQALAYIDALYSFARVAYNNTYVCPRFHTAHEITILQARHPVVEQVIGSNFVPNDTRVDHDAYTWIITGPNMGGKSTYLRQVALIALMAQCGSFVPAHTAQLPLFDRLFTRIGAGDDLAQGKSTFFVEMEETAVICQQATSHSLVILDEVGRGTSTHDGIALAQAIIEYLHNKVKTICFFATHYHELTHMADTMPGMVNYYMKSKQTEKGILFLHEIVPGVAVGSFGLEVAKLARLPATIVERAQHILATLPYETPAGEVQSSPSSEQWEEKCAAYERKLAGYAVLDTLDIEQVSPRQALDILWHIKKELLKKDG